MTRQWRLATVAAVVAAGVLVGYGLARQFGLGLSGLWRTQLDPFAAIIAGGLVLFAATRSLGRGPHVLWRLRGGDLLTAITVGLLVGVVVGIHIGIGAYCDATPPCRGQVCILLKIVRPCAVTPSQWLAAIGTGAAAAAGILAVRALLAHPHRAVTGAGG